MSYDADRKTIFNLLDSSWSTTKIYTRNQKPPSTGEWVRLTILNAAAQRAAIHTGLYRHQGIVVIEIYVPQNSGTGKGIQYGDTIASIFRGASGGGIIFRAATVREIGPTEGWYQVNVEVPFQRDEVF